MGDVLIPWYLMSTSPITDCQGTWQHVDTIHGNINVMRCSGCADRMVIHGTRRVDVPADITGRKAIVRYCRAVAC